MSWTNWGSINLQDPHPNQKSWLHQWMPLPLTVSCFSKIQISFTFLVPVDPSSPGKGVPLNGCVCVLCQTHLADSGDTVSAANRNTDVYIQISRICISRHAACVSLIWQSTHNSRTTQRTCQRSMECRMRRKHLESGPDSQLGETTSATNHVARCTDISLHAERPISRQISSLMCPKIQRRQVIMNVLHPGCACAVRLPPVLQRFEGGNI